MYLVILQLANCLKTIVISIPYNYKTIIRYSLCPIPLKDSQLPTALSNSQLQGHLIIIHSR